MTTAGATAAARPTSRTRRSRGRLGKVVSTIVLLISLMALTGVAVAGLSGIRVRVEQSGSMEPALSTGDLVLVRSTAIEQIRPGEVIGVRSPTGRVIVHRVERLDGAPAGVRVATKGDANPTGEEWTIPRGASVALVVGSVPAIGTAVNALQGPVLAVLVMLAALLLAFSALRAVWRRG